MGGQGAHPSPLAQPWAGHAPWTSPRARPGSGPGSLHSAQGPAAQAAQMRGRPGSPGRSCPPEGVEVGGGIGPCPARVPAHQTPQWEADPGVRAGEGQSRRKSRGAGMTVRLWQGQHPPGPGRGSVRRQPGSSKDGSYLLSDKRAEKRRFTRLAALSFFEILIIIKEVIISLQMTHLAFFSKPPQCNLAHRSSLYPEF